MNRPLFWITSWSSLTECGWFDNKCGHNCIDLMNFVEWTVHFIQGLFDSLCSNTWSYSCLTLITGNLFFRQQVKNVFNSTITEHGSSEFKTTPFIFIFLNIFQVRAHQVIMLIFILRCRDRCAAGGRVSEPLDRERSSRPDVASSPARRALRCGTWTGQQQRSCQPDSSHPATGRGPSESSFFTSPEHRKSCKTKVAERPATLRTLQRIVFRWARSGAAAAAADR